MSNIICLQLDSCVRNLYFLSDNTPDHDILEEYGFSQFSNIMYRDGTYFHRHCRVLWFEYYGYSYKYSQRCADQFYRFQRHLWQHQEYPLRESEFQALKILCLSKHICYKELQEYYKRVFCS